MDLLSRLVASMSVGRPRSYVVECHPPWGRRYAPVSGAGVHVILEGQAMIIRPGAEPLPLAVGDVVLLPTGQEHGMASDSDVPLMDMAEAEPVTGAVVLGPDGEPAGPQVTRMLCGAYLHDVERRHLMMRQLPTVVHLPAQLGERNTLSSVVALLAEELASPRVGSHAAVEALLELLFVATLRAWYELHPEHGWAAALSDPAIAEALGHIHRTPDHSWSVAELARRVGLSRATFAKRFTELTGRAPLAYLTWWRMILAAGLLRDTDRLLGDIGNAVGYSSGYAFANAFKRAHGVAPGRYRRGESASIP